MNQPGYVIIRYQAAYRGKPEFPARSRYLSRGLTPSTKRHSFHLGSSLDVHWSLELRFDSIFGGVTF